MIPAIDQLTPLLQRLDWRLERAAALVADVYGPGSDPYRGLHLGPADIDRSFARPPGMPTLHVTEAGVDGDDDMRLTALAERFALSDFDCDVVLIALAPEIDLRYERIYAYLQDDVTRRRPTLDLALNLLCATAADKLARRAWCASGGPLAHHGLLRLVPDPHHVQPSLLAHYLVLDDAVVRFLLGHDEMDGQRQSFVRLTRPVTDLADVIGDTTTAGALGAACAQASARRERVVLRVPTRRVGGARAVAEGVAAGLHAPLLTVQLAHPDAPALLHTALLDARLRDAVVHLDGFDAARADVVAALGTYRGVVVIGGARTGDAETFGAIDVPVPDLDPPARRRLWQRALDTVDASLTPNDLDAIVARFRLDERHVAAAVSTARDQARLRGHAAPDASHITRDDLFAAARAQTGHQLAVLTQRVGGSESWDDLVVPADAAAQLREMCERVAHGPRVLHEWGFRDKLPLGTGVTALFAGPSGTGKTMAARIIARELGLDLYRVDLASVVSKYIGETEQNLDRVFTAAETADVVLFFDEADALFGKRSEVRDSHDRYANLEISYLLQKMETYEGVAILATNMRQNLDDAFVRRLAFIVHFPFPDEASRRRIWERVWPAKTPRATTVDLDALARRFKLSGGNIRNVALTAAFLGAADDGVVSVSHVSRAVARELQKLGKSVDLAAVSTDPRTIEP